MIISWVEKDFRPKKKMHEKKKKKKNEKKNKTEKGLQHWGFECGHPPFY